MTITHATKPDPKREAQIERDKRTHPPRSPGAVAMNEIAGVAEMLGDALVEGQERFDRQTELLNRRTAVIQAAANRPCAMVRGVMCGESGKIRPLWCGSCLCSAELREGDDARSIATGTGERA